jgi:uncharacterized protein
MTAAAAAMADASERRCITTGESLPKERLVRFVVGPGDRIVPDIAGALPGRGLWVTANREALARAIRTKAFGRAAKRSVTVPDGLVADVERLLAQRCVELLGLARRAGLAAAGYVAVERWLRGRTDTMLVEAADASDSGRGRLVALAKDEAIRVLSRAELGAAFAREELSHTAIAGGLVPRLARELGRLRGFRTERTEIEDR